MPDQIRYVNRKDIDTQKWDECIHHSPDAIIYVHSFYLDAIAEQWDALVMNDYEAVMPLTWNERFGIKYVYQPFFMCQTGIFGLEVNANTIDNFLHAIPSDIKYVDIDLHESNISNGFANETFARINMILPLDRAYEQLSVKYHRLAKRMIRKSATAGLIIDENISIEACIDFYQKIYEPRLKVGDDAYRRLANMLTVAQSKNQLIKLAAMHQGNVVGVYLLLIDEKNIYSVVGGSSEEGKETGAFYFLTDFAIKKVCNTKRTFRFEGSDKKEIAFFNEQFGARITEYPHVKINRLPILLRWLKR